MLIDYDGTIAPFHRQPESAKPYSDIRRVIESVKNKPASRVVIVSGREKPRSTEAEFVIQSYKGVFNFLSKRKEMCGG